MIGQFFISSILSALFPQQCFGCKVVGKTICAHCIQAIVYDPQIVSRQTISIYTCFDYHLSVHPKLMEGWKYFGNQDVFKFLLQSIQLDLSDYDFIIPVPLHKTRIAEKGFSPPLQIAFSLSELFDIPLQESIKRTKKTSPQAKLSRQKRLENLKDVFNVVAGQQLTGKRILLIDDVVTTGATLQECKQALLDIGVEEIDGFCLMRAELK
jgi:competence protein ComFC